jgi:hypothetical protein
MGRILDLSGQTFGRLIVSSEHKQGSAGGRLWLCHCTCGNKKFVESGYLRTGGTRSCGCLRREKCSGKTHGKSYTKTYDCWARIKKRCYNPTRSSFPNYGGRGIIVCERWKNSFENFFEDMGEIPDGYTIERIDVNGNYCKENCRWATHKEQGRNKRTNRFLTLNGETRCLSEWVEITKISKSTILNRFCRGWTVEKALTTPVQKQIHKKVD